MKSVFPPGRSPRPTTGLLMIGLAILALARPAHSQSHPDHPNRVDLSGSMSPVKNQGRDRNTCNAFAATALMEYLIQEKTGEEIDLSEQFNYYTGKTRALTLEQGGYSALTPEYLHMYEGMDGLAGFLAVEAYRYGSLLEDDWEYQMRNRVQPGDPRCPALDPHRSHGQRLPTDCYTGEPPPDARDAGYRIEPEYIDRYAIGHFILANRKPVVMNILWCRACENKRTGELSMPTASQIMQAHLAGDGHVILLVGYDLCNQRFTFRNSAGPHWGNNGYGTIPEQYITEACEVCPHLPGFESRDPATREFLELASKGVSGTLQQVP